MAEINEKFIVIMKSSLHCTASNFFYIIKVIGFNKIYSVAFTRTVVNIRIIYRKVVAHKIKPFLFKFSRPYPF